MIFFPLLQDRLKWCVFVFCSPRFKLFSSNISAEFSSESLTSYRFPVGPSVGQKPSIYYGRKIIRIVAPKCKSLIISPKFWSVFFLLRSFAMRKRGVFSSGFHGGTYNLWDQLCESTDWVVHPKHPTSHSGLRSGIFKDLLFSSLPGEMVQFDVFCCSNGW